MPLRELRHPTMTVSRATAREYALTFQVLDSSLGAVAVILSTAELRQLLGDLERQLFPVLGPREETTACTHPDYVTDSEGRPRCTVCGEPLEL